MLTVSSLEFYRNMMVAASLLHVEFYFLPIIFRISIRSKCSYGYAPVVFISGDNFLF